MNTFHQQQSLADKMGIPSHLIWGYIGIIAFMIGDGLEQGWLSPYLVKQGLTMGQAAFLFTVYGITVSASSWFSGIFVQMWGPRRAMTLGLASFIIGSIGFIGWGIPSMNYAVILFGYALRGLGYPLFAYSFLVWVSYRTPQQMLGKAVGWFWFVFQLGLSVIGAFYSSYMVPKIGEIATLWSALLFVILGGVFSIIINKDTFEKQKVSDNKTKKLLKGITIMFENPKVGIGGIVKVINSAAQFGFVIFLPTYMTQYGFTVSEWLQIWGTLFFVNIIFNLIFGIIGDKFGWVNTVTWFGCVGCGIVTLALYYVPQFVGHNYWVMMIVACSYGTTLAGYVPLTALVPSLAPENKGAAMSVLNLGSGLSAFVGPAIVTLFIGTLGIEGVMWIFAILYFAGAFLTRFLTLPVTKVVEFERTEKYKMDEPKKKAYEQ
ncbi:MFS transporter [Aneurinibacillus migulanus]|uniref:Alpha-ketoglutarate permease n=1 Tax=Aneurinibacillus migulanus TaxID=47500 RepID=A0A0D1XH56_ANEMI|nr:MFS transporter [Aneurinibacillus migulanus]KIV53666.1 alpha-ketoglutarate permease [Aneurinibacillus migulanus]KON97677.1 alpha-ketoglutarate permease [Aneurinibacillus migulanus]MED0894433.1 MFS transporter [Aneurinibacillus migulanus]MED1617043.1 MFS transporter [Aneurinibacillus migulanus]SDJ35438.1 polyol permease family [Aneurinibacillus migulanus]